MSRLVSYFSLTLLFTLCACFVDYAFVIVVIKESYYYYYYYLLTLLTIGAPSRRFCRTTLVNFCDSRAPPIPTPS